MRGIVPTLLLVLVLVALFPSNDCACCKAREVRRNGRKAELNESSTPSKYMYDYKKFCEDDTAATPCCGFRSCNAFCCACGGGCRVKKRSRRSFGHEIHQSGAALFSNGNETFPLGMDSDQDGKVSLIEVQEFWGVGPGNATKRPTPFGKTATHCEIEFKQVDTNGDGLADVIELNEHF